ncbi:MAG: hypothetical protein KME03_05150 [Aphanocapsa lilacina HA4352-LM1]|nr:hypothetical protein [Aphanocapsa lilacina HA4352-LM1]
MSTGVLPAFERELGGPGAWTAATLATHDWREPVNASCRPVFCEPAR